MESKLRIPRVATAVLVLGGACDDDEKSSTDGVNTSQARQDAVLEALCKQTIECSGETDLAQCKSDYASYLDEYAGASDDCRDALLDYYDCYAAFGCEELEDLEDSAAAADQCAKSAKLDERCDG